MAAMRVLEGGADVRYVLELPGHSKLESIQVCTQVSIGARKAIHAATHPGARLHRAVVTETQTPPLHVAAPAATDAGTSPLAAAVAVERADLLAELDAEGAEDGEA